MVVRFLNFLEFLWDRVLHPLVPAHDPLRLVKRKRPLDQKDLIFRKSTSRETIVRVLAHSHVRLLKDLALWVYLATEPKEREKGTVPTPEAPTSQGTPDVSVDLEQAAAQEDLKIDEQASNLPLAPIEQLLRPIITPVARLRPDKELGRCSPWEQDLRRKTDPTSAKSRALADTLENKISLEVSLGSASAVRAGHVEKGARVVFADVGGLHAFPDEEGTHTIQLLKIPSTNL